MAPTKTGIAYLGESLGPGGDLSKVFDLIGTLDLKMVSARVTDIILDNSHPKFPKYGGWNGLGIIEYELINNPSPKTITKPIAKPLFPQFKSFPLVNEIVLLLHLPDNQIGEQDSSKIFYYLNTISLWNHPHHNGYPNIFNVENDTLIDFNGENPTGGEFIEKYNIHPILPFVGDNIFEGRFGNSIRLGSTAKSNGIPNNWSENGEAGNPITILRNGQPKDTSDKGWIPIVENINQDPSSIYLTSNQLIPIQVASTNYTGLEEQPIYPNSYKESQIILNSERLLLNSTKDSILISGQKSISLSSNEEIGINTKGKITIDSQELKLGSSEADESALLADSFLRAFNSLLGDLNLVISALATEPTLTVTPGPALTLSKSITDLQLVLNNYKSKIVKIQ